MEGKMHHTNREIAYCRDQCMIYRTTVHTDSLFESIYRFVLGESIHLLKNQPFKLAAAFAWYYSYALPL